MKDFHRQKGVGTRKFHKTEPLLIGGPLSFGYLTQESLSKANLQMYSADFFFFNSLVAVMGSGHF